MNEKIKGIIKANNLNETTLNYHREMFRMLIKQKNEAGFSLGNNNRIRIRTRHSGINYHLFLGYLKYPECFEIKENKNGYLNIFIKEDYQCHHKDGNKQNDKKENIIILRAENHLRADGKLYMFKTGRITKEEYENFLYSISFNGGY